MVQKVAVKREFEAGLRHATTGKLSTQHIGVGRFIIVGGWLVGWFWV